MLLDFKNIHNEIKQGKRILSEMSLEKIMNNRRFFLRGIVHGVSANFRER